MADLACLPLHPHWSTPRIFAAIGTPAPEGGEGVLRAATAVWHGTPGIPEIVVGEPSESPLTVLVTAGPTGDWLASTAVTSGPEGTIQRASITLSDDPWWWERGWDPVTVLSHELGHAVGLADVDRPGALMTSIIEAGEIRREVTAGDRAQIAHLRDVECLGCGVGHGGSPAIGVVLSVLGALALVRRAR